jgi:protoheme IX farnesyltransferase
MRFRILFHNRFGAIMELSRPLLSLSVAFTSIAGFLICSREWNAGCLVPFAGVLTLAFGASSFNQFQEQDTDALMERTRKRPLPLKRLSPYVAVIAASAFSITGLSILYFFANPLASILGAFDLLLYNLIYTPLKRKSPFAVFVGAFTGAIPPVIGWVSAGCDILSPQILSIALFMYFWQILHFLLLLRRLDREYKAAGIPTLPDFWCKKYDRIVLIVFVLLVCASTLLFWLFGLVKNRLLACTLVLLDFIFAIYFIRTRIVKCEDIRHERAGGTIHAYIGAVQALLIASALLQS